MGRRRIANEIKIKKVALITGGTRGIGFGIAQALARIGCDLALCGTRPLEAVEEAIAELRSSGTEVLYVRANIADSVDRRNLIEAARSRFGGIHLLINNAGIMKTTPLAEVTEEEFDQKIKSLLWMEG